MDGCCSEVPPLKIFDAAGRRLVSVRRPCLNCPWRRDVDPGEFPASRYEALRATAPGLDGASVPLGAPMFACHKSPQGEEFVCSGWLAVCGIDHVGVRLNVAQGFIDPEALRPGDDWPELFSDYAEMAQTMGDPRR